MTNNYTVPVGRWIPLSDLMNQDYDHNVDYTIHVNDIVLGLLQVTCRLNTPAENDRGREYSKFSDIEIGTDVGDHVYLRATATPIDVEVYNKVKTLNDLLNGG